MEYINGVPALKIYPGVDITYLSLKEGDRLYYRSEPPDDIMVISYCLGGRIGWKMASGSHTFIGPRGFLIHAMRACAGTELVAPNEYYRGAQIYIDLKKITLSPPEPLSGCGIDGELLYKKFLSDREFASFGGNEQTEPVFRPLFDQPGGLAPAYRRIKAAELILYLYGLENGGCRSANEYRSEQVEIIHKIHEQLSQNLGERFTIESLAKKYLMNPTTLKAAFKSVYGDSIASHMKRHRMEAAAKMLLESDLTIAQIALEVGYDSQSKFSQAFKEYYRVLPRDYRKR